MELTFEQLQDFYRLAYEDGRQAMNVCGGLSQLKPNSDVSYLAGYALYKTLAKDK